jgi:hypothetical protein
VVRSFNGYHVPGVVTVEAWPHRGMSHARAIARRIVRDPAAYLAVINTFNLPGVIVTTNINISGARAA